MNIEFHYHITFILACAAGFSEQDAYKISYSSQFVDDNSKEIKIYYKDKIFVAYPTQMYDITHHDSEEVWQTFHFIPGFSEKSNRRDGKTDFRIVKKDSILGRRLIEFSISQKNLYLIGIASHAYADTWAHQNFIGSYSNLNRLNANPSYIINNFGHADAFEMPDIINMIWHDFRLKRNIINNKKRFLDAASKIFKYYKLFFKDGSQNRLKITISRLLELLSDAIGDEMHSTIDFWSGYRRIENYSRLSQKLFGFRIPKYNSHCWFKSAVRRKYSKYIAKECFNKSDYYKFFQASKIFRNFMKKNLKNMTKSDSL